MRISDIRLKTKILRMVFLQRGLRGSIVSAQSLLKHELIKYKADKNLNSIKNFDIFAKKYGIIISDCSLPQCVHYRIDQKIEILATVGITVDRTKPNDLELNLQLIKLASFIIIYRSTKKRDLRKIVSAARLYGVPVLYELDDLIFDWRALRNDENFKALNLRTKFSLYKDSFDYRGLIRKSDGCIASTEHLKNEMENLGVDKVFLFPNVISDGQMKNRNLRELVQKQKLKDPFAIYWPSGSSSHKINFDIVADAVLEILQKDPCVSLKVSSDFLIGPKFAPSVNQITKLNWHDYHSHLLEVAKSQVIINPLLNNRFNQCKSNIKELEAAIVGTTFIGPAFIYSSFFPVGDDKKSWVSAMNTALYGEETFHDIDTWNKAIVTHSYNLGLQTAKKFAEFVATLDGGEN